MAEKSKELPLLAFPTARKWEQWLEKNHAKATGISLKFYKKNSGVRSVSYAQAVEAALCYGWIDGRANSIDDNSYQQRFTPRRSKSIWSKKNVERANQLIEAGRMKPAGLREIELAKADGRWEAAYDSPANMEIPADFLQELKKRPKAKEFFDTLNRTNLYSIAWRLQTAKKPETRQNRIKKIIEMLSKGETFH